MRKGFQVVGEDVAPPEQTSAPSAATPNADSEKALQILALSLRVVGQRFVTALSNLFTAGALLSAWLLWRSILPSPTANQLVGVSLYCGFILAVEWVRRK